MADTPRVLGYRMPAEWEPHDATWLSWPHDPVTWPNRVDRAEETFIDVIRALTPHERVELLVRDASMEDRVRGWLSDERIENVRFHRIPTADSWIRDYGPNFIRRRRDARSEIAFNRWRFNAWGNKYEALLQDDGIPDRLPLTGLRRFEPGVVLEGGSVDVNGAGAVLTTQQCLLNPNRNPQLKPDQIERLLRDYLGADQVHWLKEGIEGDDTDGHIDDIARFVNPKTIACAVEEDKRDPNHLVLHRNYMDLKSFRQADGRPYRVVPIPMPGHLTTDEGRLPASYANFYIANNVVLVPVFGTRNDRKALQILGDLFPTRRTVGIRCDDLVWGMGTIHCVTQQQPAP